MLRTTYVLRAGVHQRDLYALRDAAWLSRLSRGVYRLSELPPSRAGSGHRGYRVPKAVIALISALHVTASRPRSPTRSVSRCRVARPRPRLDWPPLRVYRMSGAMFSSGIETHERDGIPIRVYGAAKTVADWFQVSQPYRDDVALEALRTGLAERKFTLRRSCAPRLAVSSACCGRTSRRWWHDRRFRCPRCSPSMCTC